MQLTSVLQQSEHKLTQTTKKTYTHTHTHTTEAQKRDACLWRALIRTEPTATNARTSKAWKRIDTQQPVRHETCQHLERTSAGRCAAHTKKRGPQPRPSLGLLGLLRGLFGRPRENLETMMRKLQKRPRINAPTPFFFSRPSRVARTPRQREGQSDRQTD